MTGKKQQSEPKEAKVQMQDIHFTKVKSPPRVNQQGITLAHEGFKLRVVAKPKLLDAQSKEPAF